MISITARKASHEIDMTEGKLFPKILKFALPLMATGVLQLLFNAADMIVVGSFVSDTALAAVGSTSSLVTLLVNFFIGLSMGAGIAMSKSYGAHDGESGRRILHTSIPLSIISGIIITVAGLLFAEKILVIMDTPDTCLPLACEYLDIYFCGAVFNLLYNFGAAILRATGDTVRPLLFLTIAGIINVIVNLISVIVFDMGVAGVAYATVASQAVSAILIMITLATNKGYAKLELKKLHIYKTELITILKLGIPSGLQNSLFSLSNVLIQKTVNGFGETYMAGNTTSMQLEAFVYTLMNSVANTAVTAIGQNYGANKYDRIKRAILECVCFAAVVGMATGALILLLHEPLISLYTTKPQSAAVAYERMQLYLTTYFLCGIMDVMNCSMRGLGCSLMPMIIVLVGTCVLRIFWILVIFPLNPVYISVIVSYPISWTLTATAGAIAFSTVFKKKSRAFAEKAALTAAPSTAKIAD